MKKPLIFLDLDDTILDFHWAEQRALSRTFREAGLDPQPAVLARYSDINRSQWELLERGILTREQVLVRRFQLLFEEQGISASAEELGRRYEELLADGHRYIPGAEELLRAKYGRTAVTDFMRERFSGKDELYSKDLALHDDNSYIMSILSFLRGEDEDSFYSVQSFDAEYREGDYTIPQLKFSRKEGRK